MLRAGRERLAREERQDRRRLVRPAVDDASIRVSLTTRSTKTISSGPPLQRARPWEGSRGSKWGKGEMLLSSTLPSLVSSRWRRLVHSRSSITRSI